MTYQKPKKQILVVEDDFQLATLIHRALEHPIFDIVIANHGDQVRELVQKNNFSLVLLDIRLPGKDGFHILQELKTQKLTKSIPVVMLTNLDGNDQIDQGLKLGAVDYLVKANMDFPRLKNLTYTYLFDHKDERDREAIQNAFILHGTDSTKTQQQRNNCWFPWLKNELQQLEYDVWLPELPWAWEPHLERYWQYLKSFYYNSLSLLVGHGSGATAVLGTLHKLPSSRQIKLAVCVAAFYQDEGWNCQGLFTESYDWAKIRQQAETIVLIASKDDPHLSLKHVEYLAERLNVKPILLEDKNHLDQEATLSMLTFPVLLEIIKKYT